MGNIIFGSDQIGQDLFVGAVSLWMLAVSVCILCLVRVCLDRHLALEIAYLVHCTVHRHFFLSNRCPFVDLPWFGSSVFLLLLLFLFAVFFELPLSFFAFRRGVIQIMCCPFAFLTLLSFPRQHYSTYLLYTSAALYASSISFLLCGVSYLFGCFFVC